MVFRSQVLLNPGRCGSTTGEVWMSQRSTCFRSQQKLLGTISNVTFEALAGAQQRCGGRDTGSCPQRHAGASAAPGGRHPQASAPACQGELGQKMFLTMNGLYLHLSIKTIKSGGEKFFLKWVWIHTCPDSFTTNVIKKQT